MRWRGVVAAFVASCFAAAPAAAQIAPPAQTPDCSPALTNTSCRIRIDREAPSSPMPIRVAPGAVVTIVVTKRPLETITLDTTVADVAAPDPMAAILATFFPILKEFQARVSLTNTDDTFMKMTESARATAAVAPAIPILRELQWIDDRQRALKPAIDARKTEVDDVAGRIKRFRERAAGDWTPAALGVEIATLTTAIGHTRATPLPTGVVNSLRAAVRHATDAYGALGRANTAVPQDVLKDLSDGLNQVTANQAELESSLDALEAAQNAFMAVQTALEHVVPGTALSMSRTIAAGSANVSRTSTTKIAAVDSISRASVSLGTVSLIWSSTRWEISVGVLMSSLEIRKFENSPRFVDGQPLLDAAGKVNTFITETVTRPAVIPFVLAHYRIAERAAGPHRVAFLLSGGMGISPFSKSADFGLGATVAYRSLTVTPLWHLGRDIRLSNGLAIGQSLGSSPPAVATERFWVTNRFGVVLALRLPF